MGTLIEGEEVSNLSLFPPQTRGVRNLPVSSRQREASTESIDRTGERASERASERARERDQHHHADTVVCTHTHLLVETDDDLLHSQRVGEERMLAGLTICRDTSLKFTYTHTHATLTCTHIHMPHTQHRRTQDVRRGRRYKRVRKYNTEPSIYAHACKLCRSAVAPLT